MAATALEAAQALLPGWHPVKKRKAAGASADRGEPTVQALCNKYGIKSPRRMAKDGLKTASTSNGDLEFVVMAPPSDSASGNKVVVVANGRVVAVQG